MEQADEVAAFRAPQKTTKKTTKHKDDLADLTAAETAALLNERKQPTGSVHQQRAYRSQKKLAHHALAEELLQEQQQQQQPHQEESLSSEEEEFETTTRRRKQEPKIVITSFEL